MSVTIQTGAHQFNSAQIQKYALTLGGLGTTFNHLKQWDPLIGNYPRLFMVRKPISVVEYFADEPQKFNAFKHMLEYGNLGVTGLSNVTVDFDEIKGGYGGRSFEIPKGTQDSTNEITIKLLELSGSPVREILHSWVNSVVDLDTSLLHYNGMIASGKLGYSQANHTAEFIYVSTDRTGMKVEYACHLTNCFPKEIPTDQFNADDPSDHKHVEIDVKFTCSKREGIDVNKKAIKLLKAYQIMVNSLEYCTGLNDADITMNPTGYNARSGQLEARTSAGDINIGPENSNNRGQYRTQLTTTDDSLLATGIALDKSEAHWDYTTPSFTDIGNKKM